MKKRKSRHSIGIPKEGASTTTEIRDLRKKELKKWNANKKMQREKDKNKLLIPVEGTRLMAYKTREEAISLANKYYYDNIEDVQAGYFITKKQFKSYVARKFRITVKEMENNDTFKEYIR